MSEALHHQPQGSKGSKIIKTLGKRKAVLLLILALIGVIPPGCGHPGMPVGGQSFYFDTICQVTVYSLDSHENERERAQEIIDGAFLLCAGYEKLLSRTKEGSDIDRINSSGGRTVSCDSHTLEVIRRGILWGERSHGRFDITIGGVSELWDFHPEKPRLPEDAQIREALDHVDYRLIEIGDGGVRLKDPEAKLDLGGLAKGYIADRLGEYLRENGVTGAVVSLGGNVSVIGRKPGGGAFKVGVETPYSERTEVSKILELADETAVTSGVYERFFEADGKKYHHILDPETGYPAETDLISVTVTASEGSSCDCDALSTICLILGEEEGKRFLAEQEGVEGVFIGEDGILP